MKKTIACILMLVFVGLCSNVVVLAEDSLIQPFDVRIVVNEKDFATYQGLKVRVNNDSNPIFAHGFFISFDDLKDFADNRNAIVKYNAEKKMLTVGTEEYEVIEINPNSPKKFIFDKVRHIRHQNKDYFDLFDLYDGLGFASVNKLSDGITFFDANIYK